MEFEDLVAEAARLRAEAQALTAKTRQKRADLIGAWMDFRGETWEEYLDRYSDDVLRGMPDEFPEYALQSSARR